MKDAKDSAALSSLAEGLSALAARMEAEDAGQIAAALLPVIADTKNPDILQSLSATVVHLQAKDASTTVAQAATILVMAVKDAQHPNDFPKLAAVARLARRQPFILPDEGRGEVFVVARLGAKDAAQVANAIVQAMKDSTNARTLSWLSESLLAVAAQMEANDAAQSAIALVQVMQDTKDPHALASLAYGLFAVATRMEPRGRRLCDRPGALLPSFRL